MIQSGTGFLARVRSLRSSLRSLIGIYWTYIFVTGLTAVFTQVFLYSRFESLQLNVVATMVFYTGCMLSFCGFGYVVGRFRLKVASGFVLGLITTAASFMLLLVAQTPEIAYVAMFLSGIGEGFFWLAMHALELSETEDQERDFYASLLSVGDRVLSLLGPACATLLVWLSGTVLGWGTFTLLFITAPILYLAGVLVFEPRHAYRPSRVTLTDVRYYLTNGRFGGMQLNVAGEAFENSVSAVVLPVVMLAILGTSLSVGFYTTIIAIVSALFVIATSGYRNAGNRFSILTIATLLLLLSYIWLGYMFTFGALILYAIVRSTAYPLMGVSNRVIALKSMELTGRDESDAYAPMLIRDFFLWLWRIAVALLFLGVLMLLDADKVGLSAGLYLSVFGLLVTLAGARCIVRWR
jgi:YQGE family putative transporter